MKHLLRKLLIAAICALIALPALGDTAEDLTSSCKYSTKTDAGKIKYMHNGKYQNYWDGGTDGEITVTCPKGRPAQGVMVTFFKDPVSLRFEDNEGHELARYDAPYVTDWIPFDRPASAFTIKRTRPEDPLRITNVHVLGNGALPDWVQQWQLLEGDADLMLVSTHPDDEILWFGGMLPLYAGQQKKKVIVVYMTGAQNGMRTAELLDGLWTMGVRQYPDIGGLTDKTGGSMMTAVDAWGGKDTAPRRLTQALRRYRPKVVVSQSVSGEYGHLHHIVTVEALIDAVTRYSGDPDYDPESAEKYGTYQPMKLYLHLWKEGRIKFNWREPLSEFGGRTGMEVARAAYKKHVSQQKSKRKYQVHDSGVQDCSLFGLYYTSVGPDEALNDLFEHID